MSPNAPKANDIAVHNSDDSSVEPKEVSASASEVFSAGAQHVGCSDKELGNPEPTPMRKKRARRLLKVKPHKTFLRIFFF